MVMYTDVLEKCLAFWTTLYTDCKLCIIVATDGQTDRQTEIGIDKSVLSVIDLKE